MDRFIEAKDKGKGPSFLKSLESQEVFYPPIPSGSAASSSNQTSHSNSSFFPSPNNSTDSPIFTNADLLDPNGDGTLDPSWLLTSMAPLPSPLRAPSTIDPLSLVSSSTSTRSAKLAVLEGMLGGRETRSRRQKAENLLANDDGMPMSVTAVASGSGSNTTSNDGEGVGKRKRGRVPTTLNNLDAPIETRQYTCSSKTTRKTIPRSIAKRIKDTEEEELDRDGILKLVDEKRRQNTLAARKSRAAKAAYVKKLEEENALHKANEDRMLELIEDLKEENESLKAQVNGGFRGFN
ncbi:hypothetical protein BT69DRAFT_1357602 [Atractiella rhizophila]|nr:hypothetical protein BT69DRAFT_1357602 [Atractiella rhizophila]